MILNIFICQPRIKCGDQKLPHGVLCIYWDITQNIILQKTEHGGVGRFGGRFHITERKKIQTGISDISFIC